MSETPETASAYLDRVLANKDEEVNILNQINLLADETRLQIFWLLLEKPRDVTTMVEILGRSQPAVSHHLSLMHHGGLIERKREGQYVIYSVRNHEAFPKLVTLIAAFAGKKISWDRIPEHAPPIRSLQPPHRSPGSEGDEQ